MTWAAKQSKGVQRSFEGAIMEELIGQGQPSLSLSRLVDQLEIGLEPPPLQPLEIESAVDQLVSSGLIERVDDRLRVTTAGVRGFEIR